MGEAVKWRHTIKLTGLNMISDPKPNRGGSTMLAMFDCEVNGFRLNGCALIRTPKNGLVVWPPRLHGPGEDRRSVMIVENTLRHQMMEAAREAYRALGGTGAEWIPSAAPDASEPEIPADEAVDDASGVRRFLTLKGR